MKQAREEYKQLIQKLYTNKTVYRETKMCLFNSKKGKDYNGKLMIIGRAVNGWGDPTKNIDKKAAHNPVFIDSVLDYLEKATGNFKEQMIAPDEGYSHNSSAFTRLKRSIAHKLIPCPKSEANCNIVWSNLYKVSPSDKGNPSPKLMELQLPHCINILKMEIEYYQPEVIIFLTSYRNKWWWGKEVIAPLGITNILPAPLGLVEIAGTYNGKKVVVGQHPQGKNEAIHLKNILEALALIS
ncbi:MAG: hypothetical protein K9G49_10095 [Taibaiella sp.]|nr:hypothetical protein [Taibaiella sp.]